MNDRKKPEIRFKEFHDDWEQRKFDDFVTFYSGLTYAPNDVQDSGTLVLRSSNVKDGEVISADDVYVNPSKATSENVKSGDLIVVVRNGSRALIGKHAQIKRSMPNTVIGAFMTGIRSDHSEFVNALLDTPQFKKEVDMNMGATINQITGYMFSQMEFMVPSEVEQDKLGGFFKDLDNCITLHQRELDKLKIIKKSMLENCFPKNDESTPKFRFSGFTDDWEQRKVGDFLTLSKIPGHTGVDAKKLTVKLWGKGVVEKTDIFSGSENTQYYVRHAGQFMYGKLDFLHAAFGIVPANLDNYESTLDSPAFDLNGIDGQFLLERVTQEDFYLRNGMIANGSRKAKRIHEDTFLNMDFMVPSLNEQKQIGDFFRRLNNLITLHQRKLEKLNMLKKSLLKSMFA